MRRGFYVGFSMEMKIFHFSGEFSLYQMLLWEEAMPGFVTCGLLLRFQGGFRIRNGLVKLQSTVIFNGRNACIAFPDFSVE